jgi:hypothetical protein
MSQIFKKPVPNEILIKLLNSISIKTEKCFVINNDCYKKGTIYNELIKTFLDECKQYYHISKRKYLERPLTYNTFTTVLRQICNFNKITYTSQIKYDKSSYNIIYYIYLM